MNNWHKQEFDKEWILSCVKHEDFADKDQPRSYEAVSRYGEYRVQASVPGNFELDLQKAGIIDYDMFMGCNTWRLQEWEGYHVFYATRFDYQKRSGVTPELVFEGIDTIAEIFLNGISIGKADNMFVIHRFAPDNFIEGENELVVHITPACIAARDEKYSAGNLAKIYTYETLRIRKSSTMFGWDITPRIITAGLYRPAYIEYVPSERFKQAYLYTETIDYKNNIAYLALFYEFVVSGSDLSQYSVAVHGACGSSRFEAESRLWFTAGTLRIKAEDAKLWWPKGMGSRKPDLYDVQIHLKKNGQVVDTFCLKSGIRTVNLHRTSVTDEEMSGEFQFTINDEKLFVLGTNFVGVDPFHSRDIERLPQVCSLLDDINCNAIRIWGGGLYENDYVYNFCDEKGIVVWQEFMMGCAVYPVDDDFCAAIEREAVSTVRRLRNHPSIILWSGDNEVDMFYQWEARRKILGRNPNNNKVTRIVLRDVVTYEDSVRPYLPSSPFVDEEAAVLRPSAEYNTRLQYREKRRSGSIAPLQTESYGRAWYNISTDYLPENHLWGPRDYYKGDFYAKSICNFASEIGYHGAPAVKSIRKFINENRLWPWKDNPEWYAHAASPQYSSSCPFYYRIQLMANQIQVLFGMEPDNLEDYAIASQISQAEAKKFFIEMFRQGKGKRTGIIWWNLIDGWPQFSDAVVDYYYEKKLAYYYIKQIQQPVLVTFTEPRNGYHQVSIINDTGCHQEIRIKIWKWGCCEEPVLAETVGVDDEVIRTGNISFHPDRKTIYCIEWECENYSGKNHYLSGEPTYDLDTYRRFLKDYYRYEG